MPFNEKDKVRIGILNIMPEAEKYEKYLINSIANQNISVDIVLIKAKNHTYTSSDKAHLDKFYINFDKAIETKKLDGLIITGAPVETIPFENISYWSELIEIFDYAKHNIINTLGICWGGIAIGKYLGINNTIFKNKLFGVFSSEYLQKNHWINNCSTKIFNCPQSRYAGLNENELLIAENNDLIRLLVNSGEALHYIFESSDERFIAHLGHPEYNTTRILAEYNRDKLKGINNIPQHFDINNPVYSWQKSSIDFFTNWLNMIYSRKIIS